MVPSTDILTPGVRSRQEETGVLSVRLITSASTSSASCWAVVMLPRDVHEFLVLLVLWNHTPETWRMLKMFFSVAITFLPEEE